MCLIVDANTISLVLTPPPKEHEKPIHDAIFKKKAIAVYGGKLAREYAKLRRVSRLIRELDRVGAFVKVPDPDVDAMTAAIIEEGTCVSDDEHIIALARVSNVRLLCSHDQDLHADFTNLQILKPRGSVYQRKSHRHLIRLHCN
jgi:hypothetical protein